MPKPETSHAETPIAGIIMPNGHYLPGTAGSSLMVGSSYSNGMSLSGIIERMTLNSQSGVVSVHFIDQARRAFLFPTGMMAEELEAPK